MEFSVSKADLVRELGLSQGVVEKKTTIPILSNVLIETGEDKIILTATDLELGVRCSCPAKVKKEGAGTIPARKLLEYVRLLPDLELNVKFLENHWVSLTCGRARTRIAGMSRENFPELPAPPETMAEIDAESLSSMIEKTLFAISLEESRFTLNGALLLFRPESLVMVSTDGHRLAMVEVPASVPPTMAGFRALIPRKAMEEIRKLAAEAQEGEEFEFSSDENHLFFRLGARQLMSRKLSGNFPDFERVLPKEQPNRIVVPRDDMRAALERVSQFADERLKAIRVQCVPGELRLFSSLSDTGESEETLAVEYDGPEVEIGFNASYLLEFLRVLPESQASFHFKDSASAGEFRPAGDEVGYTYRYIVMPMRI